MSRLHFSKALAATILAERGLQSTQEPAAFESAPVPTPNGNPLRATTWGQSPPDRESTSLKSQPRFAFPLRGSALKKKIHTVICTCSMHHFC